MSQFWINIIFVSLSFALFLVLRFGLVLALPKNFMWQAVVYTLLLMVWQRLLTG